jgi:prepilin-type N-terminal cleavage/methylation domain-containing protein
MNSHRSAFTLIELLVVIAIIGILASLLFPAVQGALDSARKAQAKNDVVQIATAVTAYETEYGRLPTNVTTVNSTLVRILTGQDDTGNPRKIVFMEVAERKPSNAPAGKAGKSGTNSSGDFVDPWGFSYAIALDSDYDNTITSAGTNNQTLRKKVAVWNVPTGANASRRYVTSWE